MPQSETGLSAAPVVAAVRRLFALFGARHVLVVVAAAESRVEGARVRVVVVGVVKVAVAFVLEFAEVGAVDERGLGRGRSGERKVEQTRNEQRNSAQQELDHPLVEFRCEPRDAGESGHGEAGADRQQDAHEQDGFGFGPAELILGERRAQRLHDDEVHLVAEEREQANADHDVIGLSQVQGRGGGRGVNGATTSSASDRTRTIRTFHVAVTL